MNEPDVLIYVDEIPRGNGRVVLGDLVPGPYRVLLVPPRAVAPLHGHRSCEAVRLDVDWGRFRAHRRRQASGSPFDTEIARKREGELARRLAYRYDGTIVAVLTVSTVRRRLAIAGSVYAVWSGTLFRSGMVELGGRDDAIKIEQLARYLDPSTDTSVPKLVIPMPTRDYAPTPITEIITPVASTAASRIEAYPSRRVQLAPRLSGRGAATGTRSPLVGAGLAAVGAGVYLVAIDGDPTCGEPSELVVARLLTPE